MLVDRAADLSDVFPNFRDLIGNKETELQEHAAWIQIEKNEQEEQRAVIQVVRDGRTVEGAACTAAEREEHQLQKRIPSKSVQYQHALEEHYVTERNGNTNALYLLSATINAAATYNNFNPTADEHTPATPPAPTPPAEQPSLSPTQPPPPPHSLVSVQPPPDPPVLDSPLVHVVH